MNHLFHLMTNRRAHVAIVLAVVLFGVAGTVGCGKKKSLKSNTIHSLRKRCNEGGKPVRVTGKVVKSWEPPILLSDASVYRLADNSDAIWVVSLNRGAPAKGASLEVLGKPVNVYARIQRCNRRPIQDDCHTDLLTMAGVVLGGRCMLVESGRR